jgi:putative transposase
MKRSRFTEEQIIAVLREQEAGLSTAEVCRKHEISTATFYGWKAKFGGMEAHERSRTLIHRKGTVRRIGAPGTAISKSSRSTECPEDTLIRSRRVGVVGERRLILIRS